MLFVRVILDSFLFCDFVYWKEKYCFFPIKLFYFNVTAIEPQYGK